MLTWLEVLDDRWACPSGLCFTPADPMALMGGLLALLLSLAALPLLRAHPLLAAGYFARRGWLLLQGTFIGVLLLALVPWDIWETPPWELIRIPPHADIASCYNIDRSSGERSPFQPAWRGGIYDEAWLKRRGLLPLVGRDEGERVPPVEYVIPRNGEGGSIVVYRARGRQMALAIAHTTGASSAAYPIEVSHLEVRNYIWQTVQTTTSKGSELALVFSWRHYYPLAVVVGMVIALFVLVVFLKPEGEQRDVARGPYCVALLFCAQAFLLGIGGLPLWWYIGTVRNIPSGGPEGRFLLLLIGGALVPVGLAYVSFRSAARLDSPA